MENVHEGGLLRQYSVQWAYSSVISLSMSPEDHRCPSPTPVVAGMHPITQTLLYEWNFQAIETVQTVQTVQSVRDVFGLPANWLHTNGFGVRQGWCQYFFTGPLPS